MAPKTKAAAPAAEKCYGVVKAGKNDCRTAAHSCAGQAAKDGDSHAQKQFFALNEQAKANILKV